MQPPDLKRDRTVIENLTDEDNAAYILHIVEVGADGQLQLKRNVWFDRLTLNIARQLIFDPIGDILTDARYSEWQNFGKVPFPKHIEINRPKDEYGLVLTVVKLDINTGVTDDRFALDRPEGTELQVLGEKPQPAADRPAPTPPAGRKKKK